MKMRIFCSLVVLFSVLVGGFHFSSVKAKRKAGKHRWKISGKLNINNASTKKMVIIPGIGRKKAAAIVKYRQKRKFSKLNQIKRIKGIGNKLFAKMKKFLKLKGKSDIRRVKVKYTK
ncbi:MAG: helix-hairpin-helix domain-containing protein [Deltaproteobacteria bacterium]|jgi:competence protein ComEA|nr:helix-hairpin-helix domain-containing protein [Deltaproteobacteria bacterium]